MFATAVRNSVHPIRLLTNPGTLPGPVESRAVMTARIRYLAYLTETPSELAAFYQRHFALEDLGRSKEGDVSLTDGYFNLSFIKRRAELNETRTNTGLHHIGIAVDGPDEASSVKERYHALQPNFPIIAEHGGPHFGDFRIFDPEGVAISVSQCAFGMNGGVDRLPRLRHIAWNALWPEGILNFYVLMFGLREVTSGREWRELGRPNRFCGDGFTNLAIHPFYTDFEGHEAHYGVNHCGFLVSDMLGKVEAFSREIEVAKRPDTRPYAEYRLVDPEGNKFDLSQMKGWEVDIDKWAKAI